MSTRFQRLKVLTRKVIVLCGLGLLLLSSRLLAADSPHGALAIDCQSCHTTADWTTMRVDMVFDHGTQTDFPLVGRHSAAKCAECHTSLVFSDAGTQCLDCHADIHRGQFTAACEACHTPHGWTDERQMAKFHETTRFPLVGLHAALDCQACHANGQYVNLPLDCAGCHRETFNATANPAHVEAGFSLDCAECHAVDVAEWKNAKYAHTPDFPLTGGHAVSDCRACHESGYSSVSSECFACHEADYTGADEPDHAGLNYPHDCALCHTATTWDDAHFNHDETEFPLTGAHIQTACLECHVGGVFDGTTMVCAGCHQEDYDQAADPEHTAELFPTTCESCHSTAGWSPAEFDNHEQTAFPLTGAHVQVSCLECHVDGQFSGTATECLACHQNDYQEAENHVAQGYPQDCAICHNTVDWEEADFNHDNTEFPLTGAHIETNCLECHVGQIFDGTPLDCWSCHEDDYTATTDPNHVAENYPHDCAVCHNTVIWDETTFDHNSTAFPLTGAHIETNCLECHANGYTGTPTECFACHEADYNDAENHLANGYPHDCALCHNTVDWEQADFNHDNTAFPLTGAHIQTNCLECHVGGVFEGTPTDCWSCHEEDYNGAEDHAQNNYPHECLVCHTTNDWDADFNHNNTAFPLTGAHIETNCLECHVGGVYSGTPTDCWSCHEEDYNDAEDHVENNYPHDCLLCHTTSDWEGDFNHNNTAFPLTGAHIQTDCAECHVGGVYAGTPTDCWSCHEEDYNDADDHVEDNYPHDCLICHTTTDWDADFNHNNTAFPLTGAHIQTDCAECHVGGVYSGTPTDCWSCHEEDYNDADDHVEDNYPHNCELCHNTNDWDDGDFNHNNTDFPLTGAHVEANCTECHIGGVFEGTPTDCWSCHEEDYNDADDHVEDNFPHDCALCHTTNDWEDDDRFSHDATQFPLTGAHATIHCAQCHVDGNFASLPLECSSCHADEAEAAANPDHGAAGFGADCASCHDSESWMNGVYDHSLTDFPLTGAHLQPQCIDCHATSPYSQTETACASCHQEDADAVDNPDHNGTAFAQACSQCHNSSAWSEAQFDHTLASFQLTGAHLTAACVQCHVDGQFTGTSSECIGCHEADYANTVEPNHASAGFSTQCSECHNTSAWLDAEFDHSTTGFALIGTHLEPTCSQCHTSGSYSYTSAECVSCHLGDYESSVNPNHAAAGYPTNCEQCHAPTIWSDGTFDHSLSDFPLTGAHVGASCNACHAGGQFDGLGTACVTCHESDYLQTQNPDHASAGFATTCSECHTTTDWQAEFDHNSQTSFPLTGAHVGPSCIECHGTGLYSQTSVECLACHEADYEEADDPVHAGQFPTACSDCHSTSDWEGAVFDHNSQTSFPLTGAHVNANCAQCHVGEQFAGTSSDCYGCHQAEFDATSDPDHAAIGFGTDCAFCHTTGTWDDAQIDHNLTGFPLTGAHVQTACLECHVGGQYSGASSECIACHQSDYESADDPDHEAGDFASTCAQCHNTNEWSLASYDHNLSDFPLTGAHIAASCVACHENGYTETPTECVACHAEDYASADNPVHEEPVFGTQCASCHSTNNWQGADFDHSLTDFPLTGAHIAASCVQCHAGGQFTGTPSQCSSCHANDFTETSDPDHADAGFSMACQTCHTTTNWSASYNHSVTGFPLTGAHVSLGCVQCHDGGPYSNESAACNSCHQNDYDGASDPDHSDAGFSLVCNSCHTTSNWNAVFNHNTTGFPLSGAHVSLGCVQCHDSGPYTNESALCLSCHESDYNSATEPSHAGYPTTCEQCHGTLSWDGASFDHNTTAFPLTGAHVDASCLQCHTGGQYDGLATACAACHMTDYNSAAEPDHSDAGFATLCNSCHTTSNWNSPFDHATTGFPLTGAHAGQNCNSCHTGGPFSGTASECFACHADDYAGADDPDHVGGGYPTTCGQCHNAMNWEDATFDHDLSDFPLTGAHVDASCLQCHAGGQYDGLATACAACHMTDYNSAVEPDHADAGFGTMCNSCHTTSNWNSQFDHAATGFPLTGAHAGQNCNSCHTGGPFSGTASECFACHADDYAVADDPDHVGGGYPTTCGQCHNTMNWEDATFDHDLSDFPLTGAHVAANCAQCHVNGQFEGTPTQCLACHEDDYMSASDPQHDEISMSVACAECHSTDQWSPSTFDHGATAFPLTGAHVAANCAQCHVNGQFDGTSTVCIGCHQSDVDGTTNPDHSDAGFATLCNSCHTTSNWDAAYDHSITGFPLTGAHVSQSCVQCHVGGPYSDESSACVSCHQADYDEADTPPHTGYPTTCEQCHSTMTWEGASFDHSTAGFPLTGAHLSASCVQCHAGGQYDGTPTACIECHSDDYDGVANPDHSDAGFGTVCSNCHTTSNWDATFNHTTTGFPLTGAHVSLSCIQCHDSGPYSNESSACFSCHADDYNGVTNPDHSEAGFGTVCSDCHTTTNWDATFNHTTTGFPLTGAHVSLSCIQCHDSGPYSNESSACFSCHEGDYNGATNPDHTGYPTTCELCHSTSTWDDATFDHSTTDFPLTGSHVSLACAQCHVGGQYSGTPTDCYGCHADDYANVDDPDHEALTFPHACEQCHNTSDWGDADFDHSTTSFPLTGAHLNANCAACHVGGQFSGTPTDCYFCHEADYDGATPDHNAGYPLECTDCHTTSNWSSSFNHDTQHFPIYSGTHRQEWDLCIECHIGANFTTFSCIECHEHSDQNDVDNDHDEVNGYTYTPTSCYDCHENGDDLRAPRMPDERQNKTRIKGGGK